jgi:hypothetical protein
MQSLAFLCFELQMTQRYLSDITFGSAQPRANSANLNTPIGAGTLASVKKKRSKVLLRIVARIAIFAFVQHSRSSQVKNSSPDAPANTPTAGSGLSGEGWRRANRSGGNG